MDDVIYIRRYITNEDHIAVLFVKALGKDIDFTIVSNIKKERNNNLWSPINNIIIFDSEEEFMLYALKYNLVVIPNRS